MVLVRVFSIVAAVFGLMTVISGSTVLFTSGTAQRFAGNYVAFVVWFNLLSGFGYIIAGYGLWKRKQWSVVLSIFITMGLLIVLVAFMLHVNQGGPFEPRTFYSLIFRMILWLSISVISYKSFRFKNPNPQ